jgi:hypothetical protein
VNVVATAVIVGIFFAVGVIVGVVSVIALAGARSSRRAGTEPPAAPRWPGDDP